MPVEMLLLPTAMLMLLMFMFTSTGVGGMPLLDQSATPRRPMPSVENEVKTVRGTIELVNENDRTVALFGDHDLQIFEIAASATVLKDGERVELSSLARGDIAILFVDPQASDVSRIHAATRW